MHSSVSVSVIIPCYNDGQYLQESINSVLNQTTNEWEIIIVDDCSNDSNTKNIISIISSERIRTFRTPSQSGPAAARNLGISHALGRYILPLDADDRIAKTYIEKSIQLLDSREDIEIVYCLATLFGLSKGRWNIQPFKEESFVIENTIFSSAFFRRNTWMRVGGYSENMTEGMEDYDFWIKIVSRGGQVYRIEDYLFEYRIKRKSRTASLLTQNRSKEFESFAKLISNNIDYFRKEDNVKTIFFELRQRMLKERSLNSSWLWVYFFAYLVRFEISAKNYLRNLLRGS
jgi:glycosyltransferase involved in cell wall biosynthesis